MFIQLQLILLFLYPLGEQGEGLGHLDKEEEQAGPQDKACQNISQVVDTQVDSAESN